MASCLLAQRGYKIRRMRSVVDASFLVGAAACDYQVGPAGSLTVVGDAAIRKSPLPGAVSYTHLTLPTIYSV